MKYKIKNKLINHLTKNGKKNTSEIILLNSIKELQKYSIKQCKNLVKLAILFAMPVFKIYKLINKKSKTNKIKEIPTIITVKAAKISLAIKFILASLKKKMSKFYVKFKTEILLNVNNEGFSLEIKNKKQKFVLLKKFFFSYYK